MGFFRKLFGGSPKPADDNGLYFHARCHNCGTIVRVRADKQYDLNRVDGGYEWHKTIVDSKCFRRMQALVHLNDAYAITSSELSGGVFVDAADWQAQEDARQSPPVSPSDSRSTPT